MDIIILKSFIPETFLSLSILLQLIFNARIINNLKFNFPTIDQETFCQTFFILICLLMLFANLKIEGFLSNYLFTNDDGTRIIKMVLVIACLMLLKIVSQSFSLQHLSFFEFFTLFLLSVLSLLLLISCSDLISLYLTIEMQALCFYVLATFKRDSAFSTEAGLKYFISGAFISGFFLFGCSLIYGSLGTLNLNSLDLLLSVPFSNFNAELKYVVLTGIVFITSTLLFKIACAPFHFWSPDVYEGAPLSSTIIFSVIPKVSIVFFFIKWICAINIAFLDIKELLIFFGVLSTFVGTFFALSQKRLKRLIIYSSIAQIGFLVAGLATNSLGGFSAVLFFLVVYIATSILIWGHFALFYNFQSRVNYFNKQNVTSLFVSSLSNLFKLHGLWAFSFVIIFFSIGGIPPFTGFLAKIFVLFELISVGQIMAAVLLIIISSVSVFYYIRMIKVMFFEPKNIDNQQVEKFQIIFFNNSLDIIYLSFAICLFFLMVLFFFPNTLYLFCQYIILSTSIF